MYCMCVSSQNSYVEILTFNVIVFGGMNFGRGLSHDGGTLMNGIHVLIRETSESCSPFHQVTRVRRQLSMEGGPHQTLNLPASGSWIPEL